MTAKERPGGTRVTELEELVFGQGIDGKVPENLPDLVRELLAFDGRPEIYVRAILELGCYDFNADVIGVTDEALRKFPLHADIVAIKRIVEKIGKHEFDTVIKVGSDFRSVNQALLRERLEREVWLRCRECGQVFTTAHNLSEDQQAQALRLAVRRADAQFCHDTCRSRLNMRKQRGK